MNSIRQSESKQVAPQITYTRPRRILVPVDFSPASRCVSEYAVQIARDLGAQVTLLHISQTSSFSGYGSEDPRAGSLSASEQQEMAELAAEVRAMRELYPKVDGVVRVAKDPCSEILRAARELEAEMLVTSPSGYSDFKHLAYSGGGNSLICHARCPVLVVH